MKTVLTLSVISPRQVAPNVTYLEICRLRIWTLNLWPLAGKVLRQEIQRVVYFDLANVHAPRLWQVFDSHE
jgi:hypothetical protein